MVAEADQPKATQVAPARGEVRGFCPVRPGAFPYQVGFTEFAGRLAKLPP